jgi:integrase
LREIESGVRRKLNEFADELVANKEATTSDANAYLYEVALNKAKACWKDIPLQHITSRHIDSLRMDMIREGLKAPTINKNIRHIKGALSKAREWGYINKRVKFPKPLDEKEKLRYLKVEELRILFETIKDKEFADFCDFSAYSALRSGEIIRLQFDDVDNPKGFLRITSEQKNRSETRIPINKHMRGIIDRCKARRKTYPTLFRFNTVSWISQRFREYADKAGLNHCRFHDLRHTYGSHMAMKGKDLLTIKELMRHKSVASTMIYARLSPEHLKDASEDLDYGPMPVAKKED